VKTKNLICLFLLCAISLSSAQSALSGFVLIPGGTFKRGDIVTESERPLVRVDDFEMLDHPVTNGEYKRFIDATGHVAPLHWLQGQIPVGKEDYPVVFVNRHDADAYLTWLTQSDGRVYRLPTTIEFEYAARGGLIDKKYPWGDEGPTDRANYDVNNDRSFSQWQNFIKPAKWNKPNGYKLYGMAGNVWHMTINLLDPAKTPYKYRISDIPTLEGSRMGGSWARSAEYLRCGNRSELSSGIRHPDVGFRPIRQPVGTDWREQPRRLCAQSLGAGKVFLSWAMRAEDSPGQGYNVYCASSRNHCGFLVNDQPIHTTSFIDDSLTIGKRYHYYVRPVQAKGKEGRRSEWAGITITKDAELALVTFSPITRYDGLTPIFGDLDGDEALDCVIRLNNGNEEESQDPGIPVQLEAFSSYGRSLWRKDICRHDHCYGSANNVPFNVWDLDQDGKAEIITRLQIDDSVFVAVLDGLTGAVLRKTAWPEMATDFRRSSTRIHLSIAYLDGQHPAIVTQTGLYENEVFVAFDSQLHKLWKFDSFAETNGSGAHSIEVADVDGDGRQEIFDGTTCLNPDGRLRWSIYRQHPDKVTIHDFLPGRPGLEAFFLVESNAHAGIYMVDAPSGKIIWKVNREDDPRWTHGHYGWNADICGSIDGIECIVTRAGHWDENLVLYAADGRLLLEPFPNGYQPVEWDGDPVRELLGESGRRLAEFDGKKITIIPDAKPNPIPKSHLLMQADLCGDFRDELILQTTNETGAPVIAIVTATTVAAGAMSSPMEERDYRLWLGRNMGGGYPTFFDRTGMPKTLKK